MKITPHFKLSEFHCKDGSPYPEEWIESRLTPLCEALEKIREDAGGALIVNSGYRTPAYNKKLGGVEKSQHVQGRAADIQCPGLLSRDLANIIRDLIKSGEIPAGGVGLYSSFVHYDTRGRFTFWRGA